jgi:ATP-binding cassette subfamily B protein
MPKQQESLIMLREPSALNLSPLAIARQESIKGSNLSHLKKLLHFAKPYRRLLALGLTSVLLAGLTVLALGNVFQHVIDTGIATKDITGLLRGVAMMFGLVVVLAVCSYGRLVILTGVSEQMVADMRRHVLDHLLKLDLAWFEKQRTGDLLSRLTADTALLQVILSTSLPIALRNVVLCIGGISLMIATSPILCLILLVAIPFVVIILLCVGPKVRLLGKALQDQNGLNAAHLSESLTALREIQAFTREQQQSQAFAQLSSKAVNATWAYMRRRGLLTTLVITIVFTTVALLLYFGGLQVIQGHLSAGELSGFVFYAILVAGSAGALSEIYGDAQRASGSLERLTELLDTVPNIIAPPINEKRTVPAFEHLTFQSVTYAYTTRRLLPALTDINVQINKGQIVAIVGRSGAGKSTLFDLMLRFYDPQIGQVQYNGITITSFDPTDYRHAFAYVPQTPSLFSDTISNNILFGSAASEHEVINAAKNAGAHDFIMALPEGYQTLLGERGARLSGGQAQRLALARALLRKAQILLLDEATAHLDTQTEHAIQTSLFDNRADHTIIMIAHRLSTVRAADRILVLDQGRLIADGTHEVLLTSCMLYRQLAETDLAR